MGRGRPSKKSKPGGYRERSGRRMRTVSEDNRESEEENRELEEPDSIQVTENEELEVEDDGVERNPKMGCPCLNPDHGQ